MASISDRRWKKVDGRKVATGYTGEKPWQVRWREYPGGPQLTHQFKSQAEARRHLVQVEHSLMAGTYVPPKAAAETLRSYAEAHVARQDWRPNTERAARAALAHTLAVLGDRPLNAIRRSDVQAALAGIDRAPGTVRLARQHLSTVLQAAVDDGLLARNPARGVKVAKGDGGEVVPPTAAEVEALFAAAGPSWLRAAILLGAGVGLRQAEATGLTVDRVDWPGLTVRVDRQYQTTTRPWGFAPPKSAESVRTVPAASTVLAQLGGLVGRREGFVLTLDDGGTPVDHNRLGVEWRKAATAAGMEGMKFHALRHYFASTLISAGCSVKAVQKALGHASAAVTLDVYGHLMPGDEDRIRAAVEAAFAAEDSVRTEGLALAE